jgi:hypothetical protein
MPCRHWYCAQTEFFFLNEVLIRKLKNNDNWSYMGYMRLFLLLGVSFSEEF